MVTSQNGWPVLTSSTGTDKRPVPGTSVTLPGGVRAGDVATVLLEVARLFNDTVEQLVPGWCWGYNYRPIRSIDPDGEETLPGCCAIFDRDYEQAGPEELAARAWDLTVEHGLTTRDQRTLVPTIPENLDLRRLPRQDDFLIPLTTSLSNHSSATAIDLNAPRHSLGQAGTFNAKQVAAITAILRRMRGLVRWGGNYSSRKDEMHFEIIGSASDVHALAVDIAGGREPSPQPAPAKPLVDLSPDDKRYALERLPTLQVGDADGPTTASSVRLLQQICNSRGWDCGPVDGDYGSATAAGVREAQAANSLQQNGVCDADTWYGVFGSVCLVEDGVEDRAGHAPSVRILQYAMSNRGFGPSSVDGVAGPDTVAAIKRVQERYKLTVDGVAGRETWHWAVA